jgi:uncharacterized membrane protein YeaQ/YmgE (transglycosylase-associated protein family)
VFLNERYEPYYGFDAQPQLAIRLAEGATPTSLMPALLKTIHEIDAGAAVTDVVGLEQLVAQTAAGQASSNLTGFVFATLSVVSLVLVVVGSYVVVLLLLEGSLRQLALRVAFGAVPVREALRVLCAAATAAATGAALGAGAWLLLARTLTDLHLGEDHSRFFAVTLGVAGAVLGASALAAWHATQRLRRLDPAALLRV